MISPVQGVSVQGASGLSAADQSKKVSDDQSAFGDSVGSMLGSLGEAEAKVDAAAIAGATGDLTSVSDYMIAATEAQLTTEVTVAVRNRAIDSFNEIMRMQV